MRCKSFSGTKCCNSFQCLEEEGESEFEPIRIDPLNFGFGGPSRAKLDLQSPVMGKGPVIGSESCRSCSWQSYR